MEVKVCQSCKQMFHYIAGRVICPHCRKVEEEKFQAVKEYLRQYPGATLTQVSEETGVSSKLILRFLKEERLEISSDSLITLECETCGKKILSGTRCSDCTTKLIKTLNEMKGNFVENSKQDMKSKMRFLDANQYRR